MVELWQRYQEWLYHHPGLDLFVDISRMRFSEELVSQIQPKFDQAFAAMAQLEAGAIANPDEQRMVGHYWLRDAQLSPTPDLQTAITTTVTGIETFVQQVHSGAICPPTAPKFTDVLSIGIGGSALGPQFVAEAIAPDFPAMALHFIDNTDPAGILRTLNRIKDRLASTLVIVISKSGGTPETRNGMLEVQKAFGDRGLNFAPQFVAITSEGSKMDQLAQAEGWLATFPMYDWVGGRTSELSAVGLLPAALQGVDISAMLAGAREMDQATRVPQLRQNPAALLALGWYASGQGKGEKDMVVLPYKDSLLLFSRYLQQLVMESLGKELDLDGNPVYQGLAVYGNKGSTDQHAYVQQLREGVANFFITFIEVLRDSDALNPLEVEAGVTSGDYLSGLLQGTRQAIYENQRDSMTVTVPVVNATTVGALIALYERAVGLYASLVNVNAYHQPGVEAGKKAAAAVLDLQRQVVATVQAAAGPLSIEAIAAQLGQPEQAEAIYLTLRHLAFNQRQVKVQGDWGQPSSLQIQAL